MEREKDQRESANPESDQKKVRVSDDGSSDNSSSSSEPKKKTKKTKKRRHKDKSKKKRKTKKPRSISSPSESSKSEIDKLSADTASLRRQLETLVLKRKLKVQLLSSYSITNMRDATDRGATWSDVVMRDNLAPLEIPKLNATLVQKPDKAASAKSSASQKSSVAKKSASLSSSSSAKSPSRSSSSSSSSSSSASSVPKKKSKKHNRRRSKEKKDKKKKKHRKNKKRARKLSSDSSSSAASEKGLRERSREDEKVASNVQPDPAAARKRQAELPFVVRQDFFKNIIKDAELTNKRIKRAEEEKATNLLRSRFGDGLVAVNLSSILWKYGKGPQPAQKRPSPSVSALSTPSHRGKKKKHKKHKKNKKKRRAVSSSSSSSSSSGSSKPPVVPPN